jgi:hypothetical protein
METACARNAALMAAGWMSAPGGMFAGPRMPRSESNDGLPDKVARRTYLASVPHAFTRSDRSFVLQACDPDFAPLWQPYWLAVVDAAQLPRRYASKASALAAARRVERTS